MTRIYSLDKFLRDAPNLLLKRLFDQHAALGDIQFEKLKKTQIEPILEGYLKLSEETRKKFDITFKAIFNLSCKKGRKTINDAAILLFAKDPQQYAEFIALMNKQDGHYHCAILTYLDYQDVWLKTVKLYKVDVLTYWKKRQGMGNNYAAMDQESISKFRKMIGEYFYVSGHRGPECEIETFQRGEWTYFCAHVKNYPNESPQWIEGKIEPTAYIPLFSVYFAYCQLSGALNLHVSGDKQTVIDMQTLFAKAVLKLDALPPLQSKRYYEIDALRYRGFNFNLPEEIEYVAVKKIRFSSKANFADQIIVVADVSADHEAIYEQVELIAKSVRLRTYEVTQVVFEAGVRMDDGSIEDFTIRITTPNGCNLKNEDVDARLHAMLQGCGIEPKGQVEAPQLELATA